ncbi:hypothetical protein PRIPAC_80657 [Pristionchus pacificus]|nr:hypothetical protein PRIPAC_80657 [Pristionchus pacificus]
MWFPKFAPCESSAFTYSTFDADEITVNYLGNVVGTYQFTVTYNCDIRNNDFPMDEQLCTICFSLAGYREEELKLRGTDADPPDLYGTGEWDILFDTRKPMLGMYFGQDEYGISFVYYRLILTRQPNFWICLIILPTYLLGLLILVGLFFGDGGHLSVNSPNSVSPR